MKNYLYYFILLLALGFFGCQIGDNVNVDLEMTKDLQGNTYDTIHINNQAWLAKNLKIDIKDSWCYGNDTSNCRIYGRLYTLEAAKLACQQLGNEWRLPTDTDWRRLAGKFGGMNDRLLKNSPYAAEDFGESAYKALITGGISGFSAQLGGERKNDGYYSQLNVLGYYWSSTDTEGLWENTAWSYGFIYGNSTMERWAYEKTTGLACRCVQDLIKN
jgi:uncharacterized protein (TIGR02145 family)